VREKDGHLRDAQLHQMKTSDLVVMKRLRALVPTKRNESGHHQMIFSECVKRKSMDWKKAT
jgi:hypothetical protein